MRMRIFLLGLILSSFLGYLEWGTDQRMLLGQIEWEILSKLFRDPVSVLHPFIVLPLAGQILLIIAVFKPVKWLIITGISGIGLLMLLLFFIGLLGANWRVILGSLPFLFLATLTLIHWRKMNRDRNAAP